MVQLADKLWIPGYDSKEPTLDLILSLKKDYTPYFAEFHKQCETEESYYYQTVKVPVPKDFDPVIPATARAIVNVATDHVDVNNFSIEVPLSSPQAKARAERLMKFYVGCWMAQKDPVLRTAVKQAFLYGISFIKPTFDPMNWPDAPILDDYDSEEEYKDSLKEWMEKRKMSFPLRDIVVNPRTLIWDDSRLRMKWAMQTTNVPAYDVKRRYPEWLPRQKDKVTDMAEWTEYWDEEWCAYLADDQFVWGPYKHNYGFLPFFPVKTASAMDYEEGRPEERYQGILKPIHSLLETEARLVSQYSAIVRQTAWRTLDVHGPKSQAEEVATNYQLFGGVNTIPPGVVVEASPTIQVPNDILSLLDRVQTMIEEATFPNVVRGQRPTGISSGYGVSALAGMGRLVFQGVADGLRHCMEQVNSAHAKLVENRIKGKLTVHARSEIHDFDQTVGPEDIRGYYENIVQIKAEAPEEREREATLALQQYQGGIHSLYRAQRNSGITNPLEEQMQMRAEALLNTPEFITAQAQQLLALMGLQPQMEAAAGSEGAPTGNNPGSMNLGGAKLARPGEGAIQGQRMGTNQANAGAPVFPQSLADMGQLGRQLGGPMGGSVAMPNGARV